MKNEDLNGSIQSCRAYTTIKLGLEGRKLIGKEVEDESGLSIAVLLLVS